MSNIIQIISSLAILLVMAVIFSCMFFEKKTGIPSVPTLPWVRKKILSAIESRFAKDKTWKMAELGCGWGGINLDLAKNFTNSAIIGYEVSTFPYLMSKVRAYFCSRHIKILQKSFFDADLTQFDVIVCYLGPMILTKLRPQLAGLKPQTLVISNAFAVEGWEPVEILHTHVGMKIPIYVYVT